MDDTVTYAYHATMVGAPPDTTGDVGIHRDLVQSETYLAQVGWSQWQHESTFAGDAYGYRWAPAPAQPLDGQQWATAAPAHLEEGPAAACVVWSPFSEESFFQQQHQQQQQTPGYQDGNPYEDSWASTMPPTPQLTPTWHHAQTVPGQARAAHAALQGIEVGEKTPATSPALGTQHSHKPRGQPLTTSQALGWKPQSTRTDTMAMPPGESESDVLEAGASGSKVPRLEEPEIAAPSTSTGTGKKYRVKNRAAAKRCRDNSRQFEIDLAAREKQVTEDHIFLEASAAALREEILTLKNQILQHGDCNCEVIQAYISNVASQVSNASACRPGHRR